MEHIFSLRRGDLLTPGSVYSVVRCASFILVKKTRNYWHYCLPDGRSGRVRKNKLWALIDSGRIRVNYGGTMLKRKKRVKDRTLDLHGVAHSKVDEKIRQYLNFVELPTEIITGDSPTMKHILRKIVAEYDWLCRESWTNSGKIIIEEK